MNFQKIQQLSWYMDWGGEPDMGVNSRMSGIPHKARLSRYLHNYCNLEFGWDWAKAMVESDTPLPAILDHHDLPIYRAYWWMKGEPDSLIDTVAQIGTYKCMEFTKAIHGAWHMAQEKTGRTREDHLQDLAYQQSVSIEVINAFEKLFFNIEDRRRDSKLLRHIVYPETRMVETMEGYAEQVGIDMMLMRAAYNNGVENLLQMAGDRDMYNNPASAADLASQMEGVLMAQGLFLANNGFLHQRDSQGIRRATQMLAATKAGGQETGRDQTLNFLGDMIQDEMRQLQQMDMQVKAYTD